MIDDCYIPKGERTRLGYIRLWNKGNRILAHRFEFEKIFGKIPEGMEIDHICCNKSCSNVNHLRLATRLENMRYAKSTKLSKEIVVNIHNKKAQGISVINIAKEYKVTRRCIYHILQGKNWNDLHPKTAIATVS
jgi:hypothetical protein